MEKLLNIKEACQLLRVAESTMRRWIHNKKLPCYRIGHQHYFFESELKDFVLKNRVNKE